MRKLVFILLLFSACGERNQQVENKVDVSKLINIKETSDFPALVNLARELSYQFVDSTWESDRSLIYITREVKLNGNSLGCKVGPNRQIKLLSFSTHDKRVYSDLKKQVKELGFTSTDFSKGKYLEIEETEDFEKDEMIISSVARKLEGESVVYEFIFLTI